MKLSGVLPHDGACLEIHQVDNAGHADAAAHGGPAMRLIAGLDEPESRLSRRLTAAGTRAAVVPQGLARVAEVAGASPWRALMASDAAMATLREGVPSLAAALAVPTPLPG